MANIIITTAELAGLREIQPATFEDGRKLPRIVSYKGWPRAVWRVDGPKALLIDAGPSDYAVATGSKPLMS